MNDVEWERISTGFLNYNNGVITNNNDNNWIINGNLLENESLVVDEVKNGEIVLLEL